MLVACKKHWAIMPVCVLVITIKKWMISGVRRPPTGFGNYLSPVLLGQAVGVTARIMPVCVLVIPIKKRAISPIRKDHPQRGKLEVRTLN